MMGHMERDWLEDDEMSAEETLRRFEALDPQPASDPATGQHQFVEVSATAQDGGRHDSSA